MSFDAWLLFAVTEALLCISPGPAVMMIIATGLKRGAAMSIFSNLGILAGNTVYFILSATSLGALLLASYDIFFAIKWIGAAYLIYLGVSTWLEKESLIEQPPQEQKLAGGGRLFLNALALQLANPKTLLFFVALLPQFIDTRQPVAWQIFIMGVTSVVLEFFILLAYGSLAGQASELARQPRYARVINKFCGGLLIGAGVGLATLRK
ncbi:MAG: LysE family translocator [Burkholderiales bacterium]